MITFIPAVLAQVSDKDISPEDIKIAIENINSNYLKGFQGFKCDEKVWTHSHLFLPSNTFAWVKAKTIMKLVTL